MRIFDLDGQPIGAPVPKTGTQHQYVQVGATRVVVIDGDRVRIFGRNGLQVVRRSCAPARPRRPCRRPATASS
ncbi:MAG TPA: hypothetical protein VFZ65_17640 [Planctomycetota bacterium]|nr:hypothetical protein [Planctomycetota bacterium]